MTPLQKETWDMRQSGMSRADIAQAQGVSVKTVKNRLERASKWVDADPAACIAATVAGSESIPHSFWVKSDTHSIYYKTPGDEKPTEFAEHLLSGLNDYTPPLYAPRVNTGAKGDHLFVIDLADIHFGKMCAQEETGTTYGIDQARHRAVIGTRSLLDAAQGIGVGRILFVMGNDVLHTENGKTTTSGTPQDTDGTYFQAFRAAQHASIDAIRECAEVSDVDLLHCMSNHDWRAGWGLSQTIAAHFKGHTSVRATDYNMSEIHRKYYGFERNAFLLTHGDGTKEEKIIGHFMQEAKPLVASCDHFYALLHHFHHKIAKRRGVDVFQGEKDHNGMTAIINGGPRVDNGGGVGIEYVRSPSPPDGWHHRNGYMNRQGVECFGYHPYDGQRVRFTEWF